MGFFDESSPQTTANTVRLWHFEKPIAVRDTTKYRANTFGFYSLNGRSVIQFHDRSSQKDVCAFFAYIRKHNPDPGQLPVAPFQESHPKGQETEDKARIPATVLAGSESNRVHMEVDQENCIEGSSKLSEGSEKSNKKGISSTLVEGIICKELERKVHYKSIEQ